MINIFFLPGLICGELARVIRICCQIGIIGLLVSNAVAQDLGQFRLDGDTYIVDSSMTKVRFVRKEDEANWAVRLSVKDEIGNELASYQVPKGSTVFHFDIAERGYYLLVAESEASGYSTVRTSVVVAGSRMDDALRRKSVFGLWHVHGDPGSLNIAGANWTRLMWSLADYQIDNNRNPIPRPITSPKFPRLSRDFNRIGTLAYGLPRWIDPQASKKALRMPRNESELTALVERFARDVPDFPPFFEVYNEPELAWKGSDEELVRFLRGVSSSLKRVHPEIKTLVPGFSSIDVPKLQRLISAGLLDGMDGLVVHGYVNGTPPEGEFIERVRELKAFLATIGKSDFPIFVTEFGWTTSEGSWQRPVDELTQAQYVARSLALLHAEGVAAAIYFCLDYKADNAGETGFSLVRNGGEPKPGFGAYANVTRWLSGTTFVRSLDPAAQKHLLLFSKGERDFVVVAWSESSESAMFLPSAGWSQVEDMTGRSIPRNGVIRVGRSPVFLRTDDPGILTSLVGRSASRVDGT